MLSIKDQEEWTLAAPISPSMHAVLVPSEAKRVSAVRKRGLFVCGSTQFRLEKVALRMGRSVEALFRWCCKVCLNRKQRPWFCAQQQMRLSGTIFDSINLEQERSRARFY